RPAGRPRRPLLRRTGRHLARPLRRGIGWRLSFPGRIPGPAAVSANKRYRSAASAPAMSPPPHAVPATEIAHVLALELVRAARLPAEAQRRLRAEFRDLVDAAADACYHDPGEELIRLAAGDTLTLVFLHNQAAPLECALRVARDLKSRSYLRAHMGLHSGFVYVLPGEPGERGVAGTGVETARRIMECGDAGHILLSGAMEALLGSLSRGPCRLHEPGERQVEEALRLRLFNVAAEDLGNPAVPTRLAAQVGVEEAPPAPQSLGVTGPGRAGPAAPEVRSL